MHSPTEDQPLALDSPDTVRQVRQVLDRAGYSEDRLHEELRLGDWPAGQVRTPQSPALPMWLYRTRGRQPLHTLLRLFLLGMPVELDAARAAVQPMRLEDWQSLGLLRVEGTTVTALVDLFPHRHLILVSDSPWHAHQAASLVMNLSVSGLRLAHVAVRRPGQLTLDLGTGCGLLAFLAAEHSQHVWATDFNARAVTMAQFGAQLNGVANVTCLQGDLFQPVLGKQFDLILTNPPFVISPSADRLWRDSGMRGDHFCRKVIREAPAHLNEGGYFHLIGNWAHVAGRDWRQDLEAWFAGTGCDTWALQFETYDPASYALSWLDYHPGDDPRQKAQELEAWVAFFEREKIEAISYGIITMRRRSGKPNWFVCDEVPAPEGPCGDAVRAGFERRDALELLDDPALLEFRVRLSPELHWEQQLAPSDTGWSLQQARIRLGSGLAFGGVVDGAVLALLQRCRGERRLREILGELAEAHKWDLAAAAPSFARVARTLVEKGFLIPVLQ